jgi:CDGSH-type Zn-finger protein
MAVKVTIVNNGPIRIEGEFTIQDADGNVYGLGGRSLISLCRCGLAENKPFCDGSHRRNGFSSECKARDLPAPAPKVVPGTSGA